LLSLHDLLQLPLHLTVIRVEIVKLPDIGLGVFPPLPPEVRVHYQPLDSLCKTRPVVQRHEQAGPAVGWHQETADETLLRKLVEDHHRWTGSLRAREVLDQWAEARTKFIKVFPHEYKRVLVERAARAEAAAATGKASAGAAAVAAK